MRGGVMKRNGSFFRPVHRTFWGTFLVLLAIWLISPQTTFAAGAEDGIMIQGFGWNSTVKGTPSKWFSLVGERADDLADLGVTMVWLPPVSRSVSPQGYMPGDLYDLGTPQSPTFYGHQAMLSDCIAKLHKAGIKVLADLVFNHRCAGQQDSNGIWNIFHFPSNKASWEQWAVCRGEYGGTGNQDSGENFQAAPDIDLSNDKVQEDLIGWMKWLEKLGFDGWRYDFVKGYDAKFIGKFDSATTPVFSVGELWTDMSFSGSYLNLNQDPHRQKLCDWLDKAGKKASAFDFTTKGILQVAVNGEYGRLRDGAGKPSGLIGWWPDRAVTFLDNHDTGSQQGHWPFPGEKVMQGYAYILTHPGTPCIFWEHVYDWKLKDQIKKLTAIRKQFGIKASSKVVIQKAEQGIYAAIIDDKVAVKIGWVDWAPEASFKILASGEQYAVWGKGGAATRSGATRSGATRPGTTRSGTNRR